MIGVLAVWAAILWKEIPRWEEERAEKKRIFWEECEEIREEMVGVHTADIAKIRKPTRPARKKHRH